jgi:Fe2+ transport system protein FeoA
MEKIIPLSHLKTNEQARISKIRGDRKVANRLADLGLTPNAEVKLLRKGSKTPVEISVRRTRLAIANDIAKLILVKL